MRDASSYWFGVPNAGSVLTQLRVCAVARPNPPALCGSARPYLRSPLSIMPERRHQAGRADLLRILRGLKFKEGLARGLMGRKLRGSKLGMRFHISDAVGAGLALSIPTTSGSLIRLADR